MVRRSKIPMPTQRSPKTMDKTTTTTTTTTTATELSTTPSSRHSAISATVPPSPFVYHPPPKSATKRPSKIVPPSTPCSISTAPTEAMFSHSFDHSKDTEMMTTPLPSAATSVHNSSACDSAGIPSHNLRSKLDLLEQKWKVNSSAPRPAAQAKASNKNTTKAAAMIRPRQETQVAHSSSSKVIPIVQEDAPMTPKPMVRRDPHGMIELSPLSMYSSGGGDDEFLVHGCPALPTNEEPHNDGVYDRLYPFADPPSTPNLMPRTTKRPSRIPVLASPASFKSRTPSHPTRIPTPKIFSPKSAQSKDKTQQQQSPAVMSSLVLPKLQNVVVAPRAPPDDTSEDPQFQVLYVQRKPPTRRFHHASGVVQRWWRGSLVRSRRLSCGSHKKKRVDLVFPPPSSPRNAAATRLQTAWRRHHAHHEWMAIKWAAATILARVRAHLVQEQYQRYAMSTYLAVPVVEERVMPPSFMDVEDKQTVAAICLQRTWRRFAQRERGSRDDEQELTAQSLQQPERFTKHPQEELHAELQGLSASYVREFLLEFLEGAHELENSKPVPLEPQLQENVPGQDEGEKPSSSRTEDAPTLVLPATMWKFSNLRRMTACLMKTNMSGLMKNLAACKIQSVYRGRSARRQYCELLVQRERELFGMDKDWGASNDESPSLDNESRNPRYERDENSVNSGIPCRHIYGGKTARNNNDSPTETTQISESSSYTPVNSTVAAKAGASEIVQQAFSIYHSLERRHELVVLFRRQKNKVLSSKQEQQLIDHTIRKSILPLQRRWRRQSATKKYLKGLQEDDNGLSSNVAAVNLQRWYRGVTQRRIYQSLSLENTRRNSACKIQSFARGALVRRQYRDQLECANELAQAEKEWDAACHIQRAARRAVYQKEYRRVREQQVASASLIQSSYRGYSQRQKFKLLVAIEKQAAKTQGVKSSCNRGPPAKSKIKKLLKGSHFRSLERIQKRTAASLKIQAAFRGSRCRRALDKRVCRVDNLGPPLPGIPAKQPLGVLNTSTVSIQPKVANPLPVSHTKSVPLSKPGYKFPKVPSEQSKQPSTLSSAPSMTAQAKVVRQADSTTVWSLPIAKPGYNFPKSPLEQPEAVLSAAKPNSTKQVEVAYSPPVAPVVADATSSGLWTAAESVRKDRENAAPKLDSDSIDSRKVKALHSGKEPSQQTSLANSRKPLLTSNPARSKRPISTGRLAKKKAPLFMPSPSKKAAPSSSDQSSIDLGGIFRRAYAVHRAKHWGNNTARNAAARRLQKWWRMYCMLVIHLRQRRRAAIVIESYYRVYRCRALARQRYQSLIVVQRWTRHTFAQRENRRRISTELVVVRLLRVLAVLRLSLLVLLIFFVLFLVSALIWCEPIRDAFDGFNVRLIC